MDARADIETRAAQWLVRRTGTDWSADDRHALEAWLMADARHRAAFLAAENAWRQADRLRELRPIDGAVDPDILLAAVPECALPRRARSSVTWGARRWRRPLAIAAALVGAVMSATLFLSKHWTTDTYATEVGGFQRVVLLDGSTMALNTNTAVRVAFDDARRRVRLLQGEASFKVARDLARPFEVEAADTVFRALGTAFSVRLDADRAQVWVTEGRVEMAAATGANTADTQRLDHRKHGAPARLPTLTAGDTATAVPGGFVLDRIDHEELTRRLAWQRGELAFAGESLAEAVAEFNRYNHEQLVIDDADLAALTIGGNFQATDVESFVVALERSFDIRVHRVAGEGWHLHR